MFTVVLVAVACRIAAEHSDMGMMALFNFKRCVDERLR
jgi:hypothetical protein